MPEVGEEIVGTWLRYCKGCDFVDYNVVVREGPGEIDVVGIDLVNRRAYICEVATHTGGLGYKDNRATIIGKFQRAVKYGSKYLRDFDSTYMFWAPVVRGGAQMKAVEEAQHVLKRDSGIELELVINGAFTQRLKHLRSEAGKQSRNSPHSVFRLLQIEQQAGKQVGE